MYYPRDEAIKVGESNERDRRSFDFSQYLLTIFGNSHSLQRRLCVFVIWGRVTLSLTQENSLCNDPLMHIISTYLVSILF